MNLIVPMFTMVMLTLATGLLGLVGRVSAVRRRDMRIQDFQILDLAKAPTFVARSTKHLANLFEMPTLFYVACLLALHLQTERPEFLYIAWTYVALRIVHSVIHLTYNRVSHRLAAFMLSNICLAVFWIRLVVTAG